MDTHLAPGAAATAPPLAPRVTVIIPFYGEDLAQLARCVEAVRGQAYPQALVEILVADNNVDPVVPEAGLGEARVLYAPKPGSYSARNLALRHATGAVIAFTDADCVPSPAWLEQGVAALQAPGTGMVAGAIQLTYAGRRPNAFEVYDSCVHMRQQAYLEESHFGATANLIIWRKVVDAAGRFDDELLSGGDKALGIKVWEMGYGQRYCSEAAVEHPARASFDEIASKSCRLLGQKYVQWRRGKDGLPTLLKNEWRGLAGRLRLIRARAGEFSYGQVACAMAIAVAVQVLRYHELVRLSRGRPLRR